MNKILEIIKKREKETKRISAIWDWVKVFPKNQWALLCSLENGKFYEDENEIAFYTKKAEKISIPKNLFVEKTSTKAIYGGPRTVKIEKSLIDNGVFEITDGVGNYIKIRVEPMFSEISTNQQGYTFVRMNGQRLALFYIALSQGLFKRPKKGQIFYEGHNDGSCTLF